MSNAVLNDKTIREALHKTFLKTHELTGNRRNVNELTIATGVNDGGCAVADIVQLGIDGDDVIFSGIEIKGETDTLVRLPGQIKAYEEAFFWNTLVLTENHYEKARKIIPGTWRIIIAKRDKQEVVFEESWRGLPNNKHRMRTLLEFIWATEIAKELRRHKIKPSSKTPNINKMCRAFGETHIIKFVISTLIARHEWKRHKYEREYMDEQKSFDSIVQCASYAEKRRHANWEWRWPHDTEECIYCQNRDMCTEIIKDELEDNNV